MVEELRGGKKTKTFGSRAEVWHGNAKKNNWWTY